MRQSSSVFSGTSFLAGGGEMGERIRAFDWSTTELGPAENWPQSLKTAVRIMLTSRQPIWVGWGKQLIYFYNDPYKSIIGGKHPEALGQPTHLVWREIWSQIAPLLEKAMDGDEGTHVESQMLIMERYGYAEETYYTFSYSPIPGDDGTAGGIICANTDDTQRVIGERQLALLRTLAAGAADARTWQEACTRSAGALASNPRDLPFALIYIADTDGTTLSLAGASGIDPGHPAAPRQIAATESALWPVAEAMRSHELTVVEQLHAQDGYALPSGAWNRPTTKAAVVPIAAAGQTGKGGVLIVGLNPFRKVDDGYRNFLSLVAGQIAASIANAQAYEAERERAESLAELDRAKTAFYSNVSHEFRTPLTLMLGPLQEAIDRADGVLPDAAVEELRVVHRNGLRLLKLVNTLLDFSRIEAGRVQAHYQPTDLAKFTSDLSSIFRSAIERAGMQLKVDCEAVGEPVYVDRSMWEKIVLNLLSNSFKFTFDGTISVVVRKSGDSAELVVRDTGCGIPEAELPRLFERFHRVEGTKSRTHEGTGIGLALVQELVRLHGGMVTAESKVGEGSAFTVRIPLGRAHLPADRISDEEAALGSSRGAAAFVEEASRSLADAGLEPERLYESDAASDVQPEGARARIVLADDNADMRRYVRRLLVPQYDVEAVSDGAQALAAVKRLRPDLVISDVMMPNLDGFGLLKELRADGTSASVPVILLSARAGEESTLEGLQAGADDYLVKPFTARELLGRINALLERKRFQHELAAAHDRLRIALSAAKMAAWEWDPVADRAVISDTASQVYGLTPGATLGNSREGFALVHPEDLDAHRARLQEAIESAGSFHTQFRIIRPVDGAIAWMEERGLAQRDPASGEIRVVGVIMDVTAAKFAEQERENLLERERAARAEAELASRLKEDFLTTLSHELRTPLNAILGWSQLLTHGERDNQLVDEGLAAISRNARAQTQLIEDLLDMSRITSGKLRLEVERVELSDVIAAAIESVRPAAEAKGIRLIKVLDSPRSVVSGDPHRLQQVVWNLLSNAIKFTPRGGRVQVVLERVDSIVQLSVIDNGKGIPPEFLPHVFERFRQADASTTRRHGGLGLGLAIVKQLTELHGGTVRVKSAGDGLGATFIVSLPLAVAHLGEHDPEPSATGSNLMETVESIPLTGLRVLVVDDEPDARGLVKRILEGCHAKVSLAESASEAFELFKKERHDVIVSDIGMPGQDGYAFMRRIRSLPGEQGGRVPSAALTAYARPQDRRQALMAGYQSHVVKPADPAELITVVASLAGRLGKSA